MISNPTNPFSMLKDEHQKVKSQIIEYKTTADNNKKTDLAKKISEELVMHTAVEEEIIYPRIRQISADANSLIEQSIEEHNEAKKHILDIANSTSQDEAGRYMQMLEDSINKHIKKEESLIFPMAENNLRDEMPKMAADMLAFKAKSKADEMMEKLKSMA